jgi:hypothetical protein
MKIIGPLILGVTRKTTPISTPVPINSVVAKPVPIIYATCIINIILLFIFKNITYVRYI